MKFLIVNETKEKVPRKRLSELEAFMNQKLPLKNREITLVFLSKAKARKLNFEFRHKDYPTDVLSFQSDEPDSWGELILSPHVLKRQSKEHGLSFRDELTYMIIHGTLHLLGYDHEKDPREAKKMFSKQDRLFEDFLKKVSF